jgi:hypothetical protein
MDTNLMNERLFQSIEKEFYFESLFILSSLIESFCKIQAKEFESGRISFEDSINIIQRHNIINSNSSNRLHKWRENRNTIVHDLITKSTDESLLKFIIDEGRELLAILEGKNHE